MANDNEMKTLDYGAFLRDLETKRAVLDQAIASIRAVLAGGEGTEGMSFVKMAVDTANPAMHNGDVPVGAFLGKSIPEGAKLCLQIVKRKLTSREIADYLKKGGIETASKSFPTQVHSILTRATKSNGSPIVKLDRSHWGLAEWYPASLRSGSTGAEKRTTKGKRGRKPRSKATAETQVIDQKAPVVESGLQDRILKQLRSKPDIAVAPAEIAATLGVRVQTIHFLLGKLAFRKQAERTAEGKYKAA